MMRASLLAMATSGVASAPMPIMKDAPALLHHEDQHSKANTTKWLANALDYGFLSTISARTEGTSPGAPFGNPYSYALVDGTPYFYLFMGDASATDALQPDSSSSLASLSLSASSFGNVNDKDDKEIAVDECNIKAGGDPESPLCARLVFTGNLVNATEGEATPAKAALFERHPSMAFWPDHGWFVAKLVIRSIFFLDFYGPASVIQPEAYRAAIPNAGPYSKYVADLADVSKNFEGEVYNPIDEKGLQSWTCPHIMPRGMKPPFWCKPELARWTTHTLSWGTLTTLAKSSHDGATVSGAPFGNIASFADIDGVPYFYTSMLDPTGQDAFGKGADSRASLTLTHSELGNVRKGGSDLPAACRIGSKFYDKWFGDPENPPCTRLVLSGQLKNVTDAGELNAAKAELFARHPQFATYPGGHDFFVSKLDISGVWMISMYGYASVVTPADYLNAYQ